MILNPPASTVEPSGLSAVQPVGASGRSGINFEKSTTSKCCGSSARRKSAQKTTKEKTESGKLFEFQGKSPEVHPTCFLASGSKIIGDVVLEENVSIWFNTVIRGDVEP